MRRDHDLRPVARNEPAESFPVGGSKLPSTAPQIRAAHRIQYSRSFRCDLSRAQLRGQGTLTAGYVPMPLLQDQLHVQTLHVSPERLFVPASSTRMFDGLPRRTTLSPLAVTDFGFFARLARAI
uniref:Uncharacterized protein n=1 Tax=Mycena chlorophos TaxID=658473 RepID=A0ABQ0LWS0_MYCCL|nr:predicted protein [Mycena chlorophos]